MLSVLFFLFLLPLFAQDTEVNKDDRLIRQLLKDQESAWNQGDIEKFMEGYWRSPQLQFVTADGLIYGWERTRQRYLHRYPDGQAMGLLSFELLDIARRSPKVYTVVGTYHLDREGLEDLSGYFQLVLQKIKGKWKIVADSTH